MDAKERTYLSFYIPLSVDNSTRARWSMGRAAWLVSTPPVRENENSRRLLGRARRAEHRRR